MFLSSLATIKTNFKDADFWLVRRGSISCVGQPVRTFNPEHIGIKVTRTDVLLPNYLFYCFMHWHTQKIFEPLATGSLTLVNIKTSDIKNIKIAAAAR